MESPSESTISVWSKLTSPENRWKVATVILCAYGFVKEVRPSEAYLTEYLIGPHKNISMNDVNHKIYPVWTYSYLAILLPVFLLTDVLRYKPVIVFEGVAYLVTWALLLWADGVLAMQFMQFVYGVATATEVAYYSYIYAVTNSENFQKVTSYTRGFILCGRFLAGLLGQVLLSTKVASYFDLNCISMAMVSVAMVLAIMLPSVPTSTYFHHIETSPDGNTGEQRVQIDDNKSNGQNVDTSEPSSHVENPTDPPSSRGNSIDVDVTFEGNENAQMTSCQKCCFYNFRPLWQDFKLSYGNRSLLKWSIWWAVATCGNFQVGNYVQPLWEHIYPDNPDASLYNGAVEAVSTLAGAAVAFSLMFLQVNWNIFGELLLGVISLVDAVLLISMALTQHIWVAYLFYIFFRVSYQMLVTIASYQIASQLQIERYALVFGCNTFVALALESILTAIVVDQRGLHLSIDIQFIINGSYFAVMGIAFLCVAIYSITKLGWRRSWEMRKPTSYQEMRD